MGRKKESHYVPYRIAQQIARENNLTTRAQYRKYRKDNEALYLPFVPDRVYEEWEGWNLFLGTTNSFEKTMRTRKKKVFREYWNAVRWAQVQAKHYGITSSSKWREWYEEYEVPDDIPKRPEQVYEGFSWKVWLGLDVMSIADAAKNVDKIMCLHPVVGQSANVMKMVLWRDGYGKMLSVLEEREDIGMPVKMYCVESNADVEYMSSMLGRMGTKQYDDSVIVANPYELFYELDNALLIYKPSGGTFRQV